MNKKYNVALSDEEQNKLHSLLRSGKLSRSLTKRANLLLTIDENSKYPLTLKQASKQLGISISCVTTVAKDFATNGFEQCMTYHRNPKQNNIRKISGEQEARIIALACGPAPEGHSAWSINLLRDKAIELQIIEPISYETMRSTLKKTNCSLTELNTGASRQNKMPNS